MIFYDGHVLRRAFYRCDINWPVSREANFRRRLQGSSFELNTGLNLFSVRTSEALLMGSQAIFSGHLLLLGAPAWGKSPNAQLICVLQ